MTFDEAHAEAARRFEDDEDFRGRVFRAVAAAAVGTSGPFYVVAAVAIVQTEHAVKELDS